ncbi:glycosyltransferase [Gymnodinialimonas mytili]|uniref:glycosyltransferase n=1 Tax=Gymnodinialimonas mytili TaxID=3126503 RepID=UPI003F7194DB
MNLNFEPAWPNLKLGQTTNQNFLKRLGQLGRAVLRCWRERQFLDDSDVWIARNFDMLAMAWAVRALTQRKDVRLVYECLDIHGLFTRPDMIGRLMRWLERRLLSRTALLVVSSPGFLRAYFGPIQGYDGPVSLVENKIWQQEGSSQRPSAPRQAAVDGPLVLGWVGSLRCQTSLDLLAAAALHLGPKLQVVFHGNVHHHAVENFDAIVAAHDNITHAGPYKYPDDLGPIYASCDLVWSQDLWQRGANSDWLLPNRIYEAGFHACPSIAVAGTETGRRIAEERMGFVIDEPSVGLLTELLTSLTPAAIAEASRRLLEMPESKFRMFPEELESLLAPVLPPEARDLVDAAE